MSSIIMVYSTDMSQREGWSTMVSKHMFMKVRKKNAVRSANTMLQRAVVNGVYLY